jgi:hypothetical protein
VVAIIRAKNATLDWMTWTEGVGRCDAQKTPFENEKLFFHYQSLPISFWNGAQK